MVYAEPVLLPTGMFSSFSTITGRQARSPMVTGRDAWAAGHEYRHRLSPYSIPPDYCLHFTPPIAGPGQTPLIFRHSAVISYRHFTGEAFGFSGVYHCSASDRSLIYRRMPLFTDLFLGRHYGYGLMSRQFQYLSHGIVNNFSTPSTGGISTPRSPLRHTGLLQMFVCQLSLHQFMVTILTESRRALSEVTDFLASGIAWP